MKPSGRAAENHVNAVGLPQVVRLLDGPEEPKRDWQIEYDGTVDPESGRVELPVPIYPPCPFEACPDCVAERGQ